MRPPSLTRRVASILVIVVAFCATALANEEKWQKFCLNIYIVVAPATPGKGHLADKYTDQKPRSDGNIDYTDVETYLPASAFKDGVATFDPGSKIPGANRFKPLIDKMLRDINTISKDCKVWFEGATIHFIDPSKIEFEYKYDRGKGKKPRLGKKKGRLSDWMNGKTEEGMPTIDPDKKIDNYEFLDAFRAFTKKIDPNPKCLAMAFVHYPESDGSRSERGKGHAPGNHSIVDFPKIADPLEAGHTAMHELLHNIGMASDYTVQKDEKTKKPKLAKKKEKGNPLHDDEDNNHNSDKVVEPSTKKGEYGKIDVLSSGVERSDRTISTVLKPYIRPEDCKKACDFIELRTSGDYGWLVSPVEQNPPKDYLVGPPEPKPAVTTPATPKVCTPPAKAPTAVPVGRLPVPDATTTLDQLNKMIETWKASLPPVPDPCCAAKDVDGLFDTAKEMRKSANTVSTQMRERSVELLRAAAKAKGAANAKLQQQMKDLRELRDAWKKLNKEVNNRRNELRRIQRGIPKNKRGKNAPDKDCEHAYLIPGPPLFPVDPRQSEYAVRFAYSEPEKCVATTYYVGETLFTEEVTPLISFGSPISTLVPPAMMETPSSFIPECPGSVPPGTPPATPVSTPPATEVPSDGGEPREEETPKITMVPREDLPITSVPEKTPDTSVPPAETDTPGQTDKPQETDTPKNTATPEEDVPTTTVVTETPQEKVPPQDETTTDLGLVKAEETVVRLVLTGESTGEPISGTTVKLLENEPALPVADAEPDLQLTSPENYASDAPGGAVNDSGEFEVALTDEAGDPRNPVIIEKSAGAEPTSSLPQDRNTVIQPVAINQEEFEQMVISALSAPEPGAATGLSASMAPAGGRICVSRTFQIADKPVYVVKVASDIAEEFRHNVSESGDSYIEPDPCRDKEQTTADPLFGSKGLWGQEFDNQWAIKRVGYDVASAKDWPPDPKLLEPVIVAVIDSGADWYHPDLPRSALWRNDNETPANGVDDDGNGYVDDVIGWNFIDNNHLPWDHDGHGTFVAGIIAAGQNNNTGITGINPAARIMVLKALDAFGRGHASMVAEAIIYAADNGARIINLSLGGRGLTRIEQLAVDHARSKGVILVVAAGNAGKEVSDHAPAGIAGVITVAASDRRDKRAGFSNWGPRVDIAAPGVDVLSLRARRTDLLSLIPGVKYERGAGIVGDDRAYFRASGTSFATPIVAGTLSLILARRPDLNAEAATRMVLHSAKDIETPGFDNYTGYGRLDAGAALAADPEYFIEARITGVKVIRKNGKPNLRVKGITDANQFKQSWIMIGKGNAPTKWRRIDKPIGKPRQNGVLMDLPAGLFKGGKTWTLRLVTDHKDGTSRESRFQLKLG
jgi:subtilisin family serine protease